MSIEIRQYLGTAAAMQGNSSGYPAGERHAFILYVAQKIGEEPHWDNAAAIVLEKLWGDVELRKTGLLSKGKRLEHPFSEMYPEALEHGSALLIYSGVENEHT